MSYRSDVRIVTSRKGFKELNKYVNKYLKDKNDMDSPNLLNNCHINSKGNNTCYFGWNSIKWYEWSDFNEVDSIMKGLNHLKENDLSYRYARIGESYDDYEEHYYESEKEEEQDLEFPSIERYFDDNIVKDNEIEL